VFSLTNDNSYSYPVDSQNRTLVASKKLNLNFFDRFPTPNLRYVLPDEVAFSLGQGQRRRRQSATCLQKSLHRFLWIPFFISLLEPLVLRLFLFYASVIFFRNYHLSASLMKTNKFHYTFPLLLCFLYFEFWLFLFSFQLPNKKEAEGSIFIYTLPSNSMVLLSLLTSFVVEVIKERKTIHKLVYPHHHSSVEYEDRLGMPPSYMVVDIRWDDYLQEPSEEIVQLQDPTKLVQLQDPTKLVQLQDPTKEILFQHHTTAPPISPDRKSLYQNYNLLKTHQRLFLDDQILCWRTDLRSNVEHLAVLKLLITKLTKANRVNHVITKLTKPNQKLKPISAAISTAENHGKTATTENHEEIWVLLTSNFNIFVVTSALGVVASAALKRRQLLEFTWRASALPSSLNLNKLHTFHHIQMQALCLTTAC